MRKYNKYILSPFFFVLSLACLSLVACSSTDNEVINLGLTKSDFPLKSWRSPVEVKAVKLDSISVRIDNSSEFMFMGSITDDTFGQVKAQHYTELAPESISKKIPSGATYVSAKLVLVGQYINSKDENSLSEDQNFDLYELTETIPTKDFYNEELKVFKPNDGLVASPFLSFVFNAKNNKKNVTVSSEIIDYYYLDVPFPSSDNLGKKLFDLRKTENSDFANSLSKFITQFKGIAFIPNANNSLIAGFFNQTISTDFGDTLKDERSYIEITYSIVEFGTTKNEQYKFYFNNVGGTIYKYTQYIVDRTNSKFSEVQDYYTSYTETNGLAGFSAKTGLSMKISLNPLREFVKEHPNARINRAHFKLDNIIESTPRSNTASFIAGFSDETNKRIWESKIQKAIKQTITTASEFKYVYSTSSSNLLYQKSDDEEIDYYYINVSILTELYMNKVRDNQEDLILYPLNNTQPNRFYLNKSDVSFEIFYTEIN